MSTAMSLWFTKLKSRSKLERFYLPLANNHALKLFVKRDDLIDPFISGNKLRKLREGWVGRDVCRVQKGGSRHDEWAVTEGMAISRVSSSGESQ